MIERDWHGCYVGSPWGAVLTDVPEAISHPAKMAYELLKRLLYHGLELGWWKYGDTIADPFGGIGSTGILAARYLIDIRVVMVELEPRFVRCFNGHACPGLTADQWEAWRDRWGENPDLCPRCQQGFERRYQLPLNAKDDGEGHDYGLVRGRPWKDPHPYIGLRERLKLDPERIVMLQGDSRNFARLVGQCDMMLGSPPYGSEVVRTRSDVPGWPGQVQGQPYLDSYGQTPGQLGAMKPGAVNAVLGSPPWMSVLGERGEHIRDADTKDVKYSDEHPKESTTGGDRTSEKACAARRKRAENTKNIGCIVQSGNAGGLVNVETYWSEVRKVYEQCHQALKPGGVIVMVVKDYVKAGERVPLCEQTGRVMESVGFEPVELIRAWQITKTEIVTLYGKEILTKEYFGFFRQLAHRRGSPRIDFEVVLVMRKVQ
jgi:hypothetical protein